jgi:YHS domain-containing protein
VCSKKIEDVSMAFDESQYKGKTYYFCSSECKKKFDANPQKYIKKPAAKKSPAKPAAKKKPVAKKK